MSDEKRNFALLRAAESEITAILKKLEIETGSLVERIDIQDAEVTTLQDDRAIYARRVLISLVRSPGSRWA